MTVQSFESSAEVLEACLLYLMGNREKVEAILPLQNCLRLMAARQILALLALRSTGMLPA